MNRKFVLKNVLALGMVMVGLSSAVAQTTQAYPVNRVTLVTHSSPGGGSDVFLRDLAKFISPIMKTNLAVENIRGGSGAKAVAHVAKVTVDIPSKLVTIDHQNVPAPTLVSAINEAGFDTVEAVA